MVSFDEPGASFRPKICRARRTIAPYAPGDWLVLIVRRSVSESGFLAVIVHFIVHGNGLLWL